MPNRPQSRGLGPAACRLQIDCVSRSDTVSTPWFGQRITAGERANPFGRFAEGRSSTDEVNRVLGLPPRATSTRGRQRSAPPLLRAVRHRARTARRPPARRDRQPQRSMGDPGRSPFRGGPRRGRTPGAFPRPRSRYEIHSQLRHHHHLETVLAEYVEHYDTARPHPGLNLTPPESTTSLVGRSGAIRRRNVLNGLIYEYELAA